MAPYNEEEETDPILVHINSHRRNSNPNPQLFNQDLINDYTEKFNRLSVSSTSVPSYPYNNNNIIIPPAPLPTVNGGSFLGNRVNNDPSLMMNNQRFIPQYPQSGIDDQWLWRFDDYNRAFLASSLMNGYTSTPVTHQGFMAPQGFVAPQGYGGFSVPRLNNGSLLNTVDSSREATGCRCGYPNCSSQSRVEPSRELSNRFRTRPGSNLNGFRFDSGRNRVGGGGGGLNGSLSNLDYLNLARSQLYNRQLQLLLQNPNAFLQMRGQLLALARDQHGCRFLQKKFEEGRPEEIQMIFTELKGHVTQLMVDPFGNYLVQKLLEVCNEEQMTEILMFVTRDEYDLVNICLSTHGTRSVQKLLGLLKTPKQISRVMSALRNGTVLLTKDPNGHHVIQHCLKHFSNDDNKYLFNAVADHCAEIAMDRSGCCVLQQCVDRSDGELRERFVAEITANALVLAQDQYGNYVVQYLVAMHIKRITRDLVRQLKGSFESLSTQKFSSNLVEKLIRESEEEESTEVLKELLYDSNVLMILQDQFGNYVMQTALESSKGRMFSTIIKVIELHFQSLRNHPYGKRVVTAMNTLIKNQQQQQHHHHYQHQLQLHM